MSYGKGVRVELVMWTEDVGWLCEELLGWND